MTIEEMKQALMNAGIRAIPTVATFDMGLQYDYITPAGAGTGFGGMGEWPLWVFPAINEKQWDIITTAIYEGDLTADMLAGTNIDTMIKRVYLDNSQRIDYSDFLAELCNISRPVRPFYCLYDTGSYFYESVKPVFFLDEEQAKDAFFDAYCSDITEWDEMDEDEIKSWYERLDDDLSAMPFLGSDDEDEEED